MEHDMFSFAPFLSNFLVLLETTQELLEVFLFLAWIFANTAM